MHIVQDVKFEDHELAGMREILERFSEVEYAKALDCLKSFITELILVAYEKGHKNGKDQVMHAHAFNALNMQQL